MGTDWRDKEDVDETIRKMCGIEGASFSEVARIFRVSRSAVAGRAYRNGVRVNMAAKKHDPRVAEILRQRLVFANECKSRLAEERRKRAQEMKLPAVIEKPQMVIMQPRPIPKPTYTGSVSILALERHHCRYLVGDGLYCGKIKADKSYCAEHAVLCVHSSERKRDVKAHATMGMWQ